MHTHEHRATRRKQTRVHARCTHGLPSLRFLISCATNCALNFSSVRCISASSAL